MSFDELMRGLPTNPMFNTGLAILSENRRRPMSQGVADYFGAAGTALDQVRQREMQQKQIEMQQQRAQQNAEYQKALMEQMARRADQEKKAREREAEFGVALAGTKAQGVPEMLANPNMPREEADSYRQYLERAVEFAPDAATRMQAVKALQQDEQAKLSRQNQIEVAGMYAARNGAGAGKEYSGATTTFVNPNNTSQVVEGVMNMKTGRFENALTNEPVPKDFRPITTSQVGENVYGSEMAKQAAQYDADLWSKYDSAKSQLEDIQSNYGRFKDQIARAAEIAPENLVEGVGQIVFERVPFMPQQELANINMTLQSNQFLGSLERLKRAAQNGASGLGQVTWPEIERLQNRVSRLDPTARNYRGNLKRVLEDYEDIMDRVEAGVNDLSQSRRGPGGGRLTIIPNQQQAPQSDDDAFLNSLLGE